MLVSPSINYGFTFVILTSVRAVSLTANMIPPTIQPATGIKASPSPTPRTISRSFIFFSSSPLAFSRVCSARARLPLAYFTCLSDSRMFIWRPLSLDKTKLYLLVY